MQPLNPEWDREFISLLAAAEFAELDSWTPESFVAQGGHSSHEMRTWIAAYAALSAWGPYRMEDPFYAPIPEWIAGFGVTLAQPVAAGA